MALQVNRAQSNAMNLQVLKRQDDAIMEIVDMASHVVVYEFEQSSQSWKRKDVEGCLFVVKRYSSPRFQIFVNNRLSTTNLTITINDSLEVDSVDSFLILRSPDASLPGGYAIFGLWFFPEEDREKILKLVQRIAQNTRTEPPTANATPVVNQQQPQQQQPNKSAQEQQQQQPREGRRQSRQNRQKKEKQQQQEQNATNVSSSQPQHPQPPSSTTSSTSSRGRRGKRDSDASQKAKAPTTILQRPSKQPSDAAAEPSPATVDGYVRDQVSVQEPVAHAAYTPISREEGIAAGNAILGMLSQSAAAPAASAPPAIPAAGPVLVPPSVVMGGAVTSGLAPRANAPVPAPAPAANANANAAVPVSKEQLKQTLISLLDEPQFFDQIYHAYVSRVQLSRA